MTQSVFSGAWSAQSQVVRGTPIIAVRPNAVAAQPAPEHTSRRARRGGVQRRCAGRARHQPHGQDQQRPARPRRRPRGRRRWPRHGVGGGLPARRAARRRPRWCRRGLARRHRPGVVRTRLPDRPDRKDGRTNALHRQRHLGGDPAPGRHAGIAARSSRSTRTRRLRSSRSPTSAWSGTCTPCSRPWSRRSRSASPGRAPRPDRARARDRSPGRRSGDDRCRLLAGRATVAHARTTRPQRPTR